MNNGGGRHKESGGWKKNKEEQQQKTDYWCRGSSVTCTLRLAFEATREVTWKRLMNVSLESVPRKGLLSEKVSSLPSVQRSYISDRAQ
jgi:hypothetical protein